MAEGDQKYKTSDYISRRKKLSGLFFEVSLPNEYLVPIGQKKTKPILGGRRFKMFRKFLRVPASVETLYFKTDNANMDYQGIGIEGYASWRIDPQRPEVALTTLDFFDENDPMERTNSELQTICIEAVRHVIANMSIDDAGGDGNISPISKLIHEILFLLKDSGIASITGEKDGKEK